jgi:hypothetical protein
MHQIQNMSFIFFIRTKSKNKKNQYYNYFKKIFEKSHKLSDAYFLILLIETYHLFKYYATGFYQNSLYKNFFFFCCLKINQIIVSYLQKILTTKSKE